MKNVSINAEQKLYFIKGIHGYSTLGFENVNRSVDNMCKFLNTTIQKAEYGSIELYEQYLDLCQQSLELYKSHGLRMTCDLHPKLKGLEGKRVEVLSHGEKRRFYVGKSTGFNPIHLEIKKSNSLGGFAISYNETFEYVKVI